jgi:hypothetical protein
MNLEDRALAYAQLALDEVTADPRAFGITRPWSSVEEWVAWELKDNTNEDRDAIAAAMRRSRHAQRALQSRSRRSRVCDGPAGNTRSRSPSSASRRSALACSGLIRGTGATSS